MGCAMLRFVRTLSLSTVMTPGNALSPVLKPVLRDRSQAALKIRMPKTESVTLPLQARPNVDADRTRAYLKLERKTLKKRDKTEGETLHNVGIARFAT